MNIVNAFNGFSVKDLGAAQQFYSQTLGLTVDGDEEMGLHLKLPGGGVCFVYSKPDHQPASYTVLNLVVDNIDSAVDELVGKGVEFEKYGNMPGQQDDRLILRGKAVNMGPDIAWFKDPAGNIISIMEN